MIGMRRNEYLLTYTDISGEIRDNTVLQEKFGGEEGSAASVSSRNTTTLKIYF